MGVVCHLDIPGICQESLQNGSRLDLLTRQGFFLSSILKVLQQVQMVTFFWTNLGTAIVLLVAHSMQ